MANITGRQTVNNIQILEVDASPAIGLGVTASLGSIATVSDGYGVFVKTGAGDTAWAFLSSGGGGGGSGANQTLSNLTTTAVNTSLTPGSDVSYDLGSSSLRWKDGYFGPSSLHIVSTAGETGIARDWRLGISPDGYFNLFQATDGYLTVANSGNLGVGTHYPREKISTDGYVKAQGIKFLDGTAMTTAASGSGGGGGGGTLTGTGSSGAIAFWNGATSLTEDPTQLFWDNTNNRLGIGTNSPTQDIDLVKTSGGVNQIARVVGTSNSDYVQIIASRGSFADYGFIGQGHTSLFQGGIDLAAGNYTWLAGVNGSGTVIYNYNTDGLVHIGANSGTIASFRSHVESFVGNSAGGAGIGFVPASTPLERLRIDTGSYTIDPLRLDVNSSDVFHVYRTATGASGGIVANPAGANRDFRIAASGVANAIFVQGSNGFVGFNTNSPATRFYAKTTSSETLAVFRGSSSGDTIYTDVALVGDNTGFGPMVEAFTQRGSQINIASFGSGTTLTTRIGINYARNSGNGSGEFARLGAKKAPLIELNAEDGSISLLGESGTGGDLRSPLVSNYGVFVSSSGSVGIGSTNTSEKLTVSGVVAISETTTPTNTSGFGKIYPKSDGYLYFLNSGNTEYNLTTGGGGGGGSASGVSGSVQFSGGAGVFSSDAPNLFWDDTNNYLGIGTSSPTAKISVVAGTVGSTLNAFNISATLPNVAAAQEGINFNITSTGSLATNVLGLVVNLNAGYTGANSTESGVFLNATAGTATGTWSVNNTGNIGAEGQATGATAGHNSGVYGYAQSSTTQNAGVFGNAITAATGTNIGVAGTARNTSGNQIGGFFGLNIGTPSFTSAALIADNSNQTSPIFLARDNGTIVFSIIDGGNTGIGTANPITDADKPLTVSGSSGGLILFQDRSGASDAKNVFIGPEGGLVNFGLLNDAQNNGTNFFTITRSGFDVSSIDLKTGIHPTTSRLFIDGSGNVGIGTTAPNSVSHIVGSQSSSITTVSTTTTLDATHFVVLADATSGTITINLPAVSTLTGRRYTVKKIDGSANTVVLDGNGSETIDGATTQTLSGIYESLTIQNNGTAWFIV